MHREDQIGVFSRKRGPSSVANRFKDRLCCRIYSMSRDVAKLLPYISLIVEGSLVRMHMRWRTWVSTVAKDMFADQGHIVKESGREQLPLALRARRDC